MTAHRDVPHAARHDVPEDPAAVVLFSGRHDGLPGAGNVSLRVGPGDPGRVRAQLLAQAGSSLDEAVFMEQVHGAQVAEVSARDRGRGARDDRTAVPGVDALVTRDAGVALVVLVADCVPLLLVEPDGALVAVHAGRRGIGADVVGAALAAMAPADPGAVRAFIGPAIGGCCYEVPPSLADALDADLPEAASMTTWGTRSLDLPAAVTARLQAAGVRRITRYGGCTRCGPGGWFSHRRTPGEGRQAAIVCRRRPAGGRPAS